MSPAKDQNLMVICEIDSNYIDCEAMHGVIKPTNHILNNDALEVYKAVIWENCTLELVQSKPKQAKAAERTIQT